MSGSTSLPVILSFVAGMFARTAIGLSMCADGSTAATTSYLEARQAALVLLDDEQYKQAHRAFVTLRESATNQYQAADALEHAAVSAQHLGREDEAMRLAAQIPLGPQSNVVCMRLLARREAWEIVAERYGRTVFADWPRSVAAEAYYLRAQARIAHDDAVAAMRDMREASERSDDASVFFELAKVAHSLGEDVIAMDAYRQCKRAMHLQGGWRLYSSIIARADILHRNGFDKLVLAELEDMSGVRGGYWQVQKLDRRGRALAALGRKSEAEAAFREALATEGIAGVQRNRILAALESLSP